MGKEDLQEKGFPGAKKKKGQPRRPVPRRQEGDLLYSEELTGFIKNESTQSPREHVGERPARHTYLSKKKLIRIGVCSSVRPVISGGGILSGSS